MMPIDPSIALSYRPNTPLADPMELMGRIGQLRQMQQAQELHNLEAQRQRMALAQAKQAQAYEQAQREIASQSGGDYGKLVSGLMGKGFLKEAMVVQKQLADIEKEKAEAAAKSYDVDVKRLNRLGSVVSSLQNMPNLTHDTVARAIQNEVQLGTITPEQGQNYVAQVLNTADPRQFVTQAGLAVMDAEKRMQMMAPKYRDIGGQFLPENQLTGKPFEGLSPIQKTLTPKEKADIAHQRVIESQGWANQAIARERLNLESRKVESEIGKEDREQKEKALAKEGVAASLQTTLDSAKRLMTHPGLSGVVGMSMGSSYIPGTDAANFSAELDTFKAQTFLPMVQSLRGMGALSDAEGKKLTDAIGALSPMMSEKAFKASLSRITDDLDSKLRRATGKKQLSPELKLRVNSLRKKGVSEDEINAALDKMGY